MQDQPLSDAVVAGSIDDPLVTFGWAGLLFMGLYLLSLIVIGYIGYRKRTGENLRDFYLGGTGIGFLVLLFTLFATQYSGNTFFGATGSAYRSGWVWIQYVFIMMAVVACYLLYAPKLYPLARSKAFITPSDYLSHRFGSTPLTLIASLIMLYSLGNFLLAQMTAMGRAFEGLLGQGSSDGISSAFLWGVIGLAFIMVVYETLGGFRAVAWTDLIQGLVMLAGFSFLALLIFYKFGSIADINETLLQGSPSQRAKVLPPDIQANTTWFSYIIMFGLAGALYPQAIQRIYAAKHIDILKKSLAVMVFLPLFTTLLAVIMGIYASVLYPGLEGSESDRVFAVLLRDVQSDGMLGYWVVIILSTAILAAIMSTADSALLTMSSLITKDFFGRGSLSENFLTKLGKTFSWLIIIVAAFIAIVLEASESDLTLIDLLDMKFDVLVQLAPAFMLGLHWKKLTSEATLWGIFAGLAMVAWVYITNLETGGKMWGFHAGVLGLAMNLLVCIMVSFKFGWYRGDWQIIDNHKD